MVLDRSSLVCVIVDVTHAMNMRLNDIFCFEVAVFVFLQLATTAATTLHYTRGRCATTTPHTTPRDSTLRHYITLNYARAYIYNYSYNYNYTTLHHTAPTLTPTTTTTLCTKNRYRYI